MSWQVVLVINLGLVALFNGYEWLVSEEPDRSRAGRRVILALLAYPILVTLIPIIVPAACR